MAGMNVDGVALVTGAGSGIGRETGIAFAHYGAKAVVFADINLESAREAAEESRNFASNPQYDAVAIEVDTSSEQSVNAMVEETVSRFGRIDYSVNSAGVGNKNANPITNFDVNEYQRMQDVNVTGILFCMKAVMNVMKRQDFQVIKGRSRGTGERRVGRGAIVNLSSLSGLIGMPYQVQYVAAKHAVRGMTKTAALEGGRFGIRVNAICPAWTEGPMMDNVISRWPTIREEIRKACPLERMAEADEIADSIVFLCSPASSFTNGTAAIVDGGCSVTAHAV